MAVMENRMKEAENKLREEKKGTLPARECMDMEEGLTSSLYPGVADFWQGLVDISSGKCAGQVNYSKLTCSAFGKQQAIESGN